MDEAFPAFIGREWDPGYRAERIIDTVQRFGQDFDAKTELEAARKEAAARKAKAAASDVFRNEPADLAAARAERDAGAVGAKSAVTAGEDGNQVAA